MLEPLRVLVTGTRAANWPTEQIVTRALDDAREVAGAVGRTILVVHGGARGVDTIAGFWAVAAGIPCERHPADWQRIGRSAGVVRNAEMVKLGASVCLAFPRPGSVGTWDCIRRAADAGIHVRIYPLPVVQGG